MTLREIADLTGGTLHDVPDENAVVSGSVEFDSRKVTPQGLFLALPGAKVDGHEFAHAAVEAGAVAVLAARPVGVPAVVVPRVTATDSGWQGTAMALEHDVDGSGAAVLAALAKLARASVDALTAEHGLTVVGVTGSAGKTSTKDLLAAVLGPLGTTIAPPGSFNNEIGHPWTALRAVPETKFLVLEMSARGPGHIAALAKTAPPRIGVVLNVGTAHLGEFGSREMIAKTKGELVESLPPADAGGVAVLNADDPLVTAMQSRTQARVVFVGQADSADVRAVDVRLDDEARASFRLVAPQGEADVTLAVHGEHLVTNALCAAAVALECGATVEQVAQHLGAAKAVSGRRMEVVTRSDGVTVINDSYNANPDSVKAALKALVTMARAGEPPRRCWAVLGEMAELGEDSVVEHDRIGRQAVRLLVDRLIVVGTGRPPHAMHQGAVMEGSFDNESLLVPDADAAVEVLEAEVEPGDVVLVKASQSVGLWRVAEALLQQPAEGASADREIRTETSR